MKKLGFSLLVFISAQAFGQNIVKFEGVYLVNGIYTVIAGPGSGYHDSIEPSQMSIDNYGEQIILRNFADIDSIVAETKSDSFFVARNTYKFGECVTYLMGNGRIHNATLFFQYFWGSTCIDGAFRVDCVGVRDETNFLNDSKRSDGIFKCFPNPTRQNINIDLEIPERVENAILEVYQIDNKLIKLVELKNRGKFSQQINIADLNDGLLTFCILFDNKRKYSCKIIKQVSAN